MKWFTLFLSLSFLGAAVYSFLTGDIENLWFQLTFGFLLMALTAFIRKDDKECDKFFMWLGANRESLLTHGAVYEGELIHKDTVFVRYQLCVSALFISYLRQSRPFIRDHHTAPFYNLIFTAVTLVFGWWSLPVGPFRTIAALTSNLVGGKKWRVEEMLDHIQS